MNALEAIKLQNIFSDILNRSEWLLGDLKDWHKIDKENLVCINTYRSLSILIEHINKENEELEKILTNTEITIKR